VYSVLVTVFISVTICRWYTVRVPPQAEPDSPQPPQSPLTTALSPPPAQPPQSFAHVLEHMAKTATAGMTKVKTLRITRTSKGKNRNHERRAG